jgi:hypothetical protein
LVQETYARVLRRPRLLRREDDLVYKEALLTGDPRLSTIRWPAGFSTSG